MPKRARRSPQVHAPTSKEELSLKVLSIMRNTYGALPVAFWGLSKSADLLAPRTFVVSDQKSFYVYRQRVNDSSGRYPIVRVRILWWRRDKQLEIVTGVKIVNIEQQKFNSDVCISDGVEEITFDQNSAFNQQLELPLGLKRIAFGSSFNYPISLPPGLIDIYFPLDSHFNHRITLPSSIRKIAFGMYFNKPLTLGPNIEELELGDSFNQYIDLSVATKLRIVKFGFDFNKQVNLCTDSLEEVYFGYAFNQHVEFPLNIRKVVFGEKFDNPIVLPPRLEELYLSKNGVFNQFLKLDETSSLKVLQLSQKFNQPISLVEGLESVFFGQEYTCRVALPSTLKTLIFDKYSRYNQFLTLPNGLKRAVFGNMRRCVTLPLGLEELEWNTNSPIQLNDGLLIAKFGSAFRQQLILPSSLKRIVLDASYNLPLILPRGCVRIRA